MHKEELVKSLPTKKTLENLKKISEKGIKPPVFFENSQRNSTEIHESQPSLKKTSLKTKNFSQNNQSLQFPSSQSDEKFRKTNLSSLILKNMSFLLVFQRESLNFRKKNSASFEK